MARPHGTILVLDDHYGIASDDFYGREEFLHDFGVLPFRFAFSSAWDRAAGGYTVAEALRAVDEHAPHGILLDIVFDQRGSAGQLGLAILRELSARHPALPVVVMTVLTREEAWAECARLGAVDYLPKPLNARRLWQTLDRYVGVEPRYWLVGQASAFLEAVMAAAQASEGGRSSVMITGETGTGKELLARYIGRHGARAGRPFVPIHISPVPAEQQQAELFGAKRGAYTGAVQDRKGYFEQANAGLAFLDEIGEIDLRTQSNLLRVVESGEIARLGDVEPRHVDVQIISATNANLARRVKDGEFRQDLWERLRGMAIGLPALQQRVDDAVPLIRHLLRVEAVGRKRPLPALPEPLERELVRHRWSGNVRALAKYAGRVFDIAGDAPPVLAHFIQALPEMEPDQEEARPSPSTAYSPSMAAPGDAGDLAEVLQEMRVREFALLDQALQNTRDPVTRGLNRAKAAALLKRKHKCSTNEFDRWARELWLQLNPESRRRVTQQFPDMTRLLAFDAFTGSENP